ncbi:MAG: OmpH family outer membrane protein [Sphingobacteriales bacterium]|nr:OmpH family outer membrane protein [Sphingobacteriales bacterium]MBI3719430.1 OmpH family outer membrane protein [Sphingobacteriales bacterium]
MKKVSTLVLTVMAMLVFGSNVNAQNKIGYVSVDEVLSVMPEIKKLQGELASYDSSLQINYTETLKEYLAKDSSFKVDSPKLSPAVRKAKESDLEKLAGELNNFQQNYQNMVTEKRNELMKPVVNKAVTTIKEVAKAGGYTYVFAKDALLVQPEADDLLPLVKKKLGIVDAPAAKPAVPKTNN